MEPWMYLAAQILFFIGGYFFGRDRGWKEATEEFNRLLREEQDRGAA